jgi:hypothetical protein
MTTDTPRKPGRPRQTHCKRGHPLRGPEANVWIDRDGYPHCNLCVRLAVGRFIDRKNEKLLREAEDRV